MIALDTNVVVRLIVSDEPRQTAVAERLLREALERGETCFISDPVLCETAWVLDRSYKVPRGKILEALRNLSLRKSIFSFENPEVLGKALDDYHQGKADFSDFLIGAKAQALGARTTFTFDQVLSRHQGYSLLK